jgi:hypothetical protein
MKKCEAEDTRRAPNAKRRKLNGSVDLLQDVLPASDLAKAQAKGTIDIMDRRDSSGRE